MFIDLVKYATIQILTLMIFRFLNHGLAVVVLLLTKCISFSFIKNNFTISKYYFLGAFISSRTANFHFESSRTSLIFYIYMCVCVYFNISCGCLVFFLQHMVNFDYLRRVVYAYMCMLIPFL